LISIAEVVVTRPRAGQAVVGLIGEHDLATRAVLSELLASLIGENDLDLIVVDLSDAEFIDSSVLHNLVVADRLTRERGLRLRVRLGTAESVNRVLEISGLLEHLDCETGHDEPDRHDPPSSGSRP